MYELFSNDKTYKFLTGKSMTGAELKSSGEYPILEVADCAMDVVAGILRSITLVGELAESYGIDEETDNQEILNQVNAAVRNANIASNDKSRSEVALYSVARMVASTFTDEQALAVKDIYEPFEVGRTYKKDEFFTYNGELFKVVKDHTSEAQWVPGETGTESLYTKITLNDAGYPIWKQPTGAHDAYNIGDIVEYNGQLYKSKINGNTYAPDAYPDGWEVYTEES